MRWKQLEDDTERASAARTWLGQLAAERRVEIKEKKRADERKHAGPIEWPPERGPMPGGEL